MVRYRLRPFCDNLRSSLWFVPTVIVVGAVALAMGLIEADAWLGRERLMERWPRLFGAGAEGSRGLLAAIAGSMITVAGVTFSITIVALALASSQYTSRILRNFMRDRTNQTVLGVFVGVFAYCLVVLRTIRGGDEGAFVPALAVLGALLLAFVAIGFVIAFIHHIAASIQATSIIAAVAGETFEAVDRLFPTEVGDGAIERIPANRDSDLSRQPWVTIPARTTGYIQGIDADALFAIARERDVIVRMERGIGRFCHRRLSLGDGGRQVAGRRRTLKAPRRLHREDSHRPVHQDAGYGGQVRVVTRGPTFPGLLAEAFDQIRQNAEGNVAVLVRLLQVLEILVERTADDRAPSGHFVFTPT